MRLNKGTAAPAIPAMLRETSPSRVRAEINCDITAPWTRVQRVKTTPRYQKVRVDIALRKGTSISGRRWLKEGVLVRSSPSGARPYC